jgi:hypothetical protein
MLSEKKTYVAYLWFAVNNENHLPKLVWSTEFKHMLQGDIAHHCLL